MSKYTMYYMPLLIIKKLIANIFISFTLLLMNLWDLLFLELNEYFKANILSISKLGMIDITIYKNDIFASKLFIKLFGSEGNLDFRANR